MWNSICRCVFAGIISLSAPAITMAGTVEPILHIEKGEASSPQVALTLDLCMGDIDHRIFDTLVSHQIKATLFVTARWLQRNRQIVEVIKAHPDLFEVANHGKNHVPAIDNQTDIYGLKTAGSLKAVCEEIKGGEQSLLAADFPRTYWYMNQPKRASGQGVAAGILELEKKGYRFVKLSDATKPVERQTTISDCSMLEGKSATTGTSTLQGAMNGQ